MEPMALITHPDRFDEKTGKLLKAPMDCPESKLPIALQHGWIVVAMDSLDAPGYVPVRRHPYRQDSDYTKGFTE